MVFKGSGVLPMGNTHRAPKVVRVIIELCKSVSRCDKDSKSRTRPCLFFLYH